MTSKTKQLIFPNSPSRWIVLLTVGWPFRKWQKTYMTLILSTQYMTASCLNFLIIRRWHLNLGLAYLSVWVRSPENGDLLLYRSREISSWEQDGDLLRKRPSQRS